MIFPPSCSSGEEKVENIKPSKQLINSWINTNLI